jgi:hypothetical protein
MDKEREIMHKILDEEASEDEEKAFIRSGEQERGLREDFAGLQKAVRILRESERHEPPPFFTAEVMKKLPKKNPSIPTWLRQFLFGSRVLHWNMASALGAAVLILATVIVVSQVHREPVMNAAGPVEGSSTVRLTFYAPQAHTVSVAGDFNKWRTEADAMKGTDGMWSIDLKLKPGVYSYSFVVDGKSWVADPGAQSYQDDGFGSRNSILRVSI